MELKHYQKLVLRDLSLYLDSLQSNKTLSAAFSKYWENHPDTPLLPMAGTAIESYKNNVVDVPHVCVKVPTAGGKTFIACNALNVVFKKLNIRNSKTVVWLVPSVTILEQTIRSLRDVSHPYRQQINLHFQHNVEVYDKNQISTGQNFNATTVQENLTIVVMSFDSLRAKNKDDRKIYQENSNMLSFVQQNQENDHVLEGIDETAIINVLRSLNPVIIVDESHNAETDLSVEMLKNLNPSFILDLTATPRRNSNIISFVDALWLKKENMVKLPVIVHNQHNRKDVILNAIELQKRLEAIAKEEAKKGGRFIRPIVLFQAQANTKETEVFTFEKIKKLLVEKFKISAEQIKIKTANINEIKDIDLMSANCNVRFIITVNALKEGWDCPFAYILASLADRSSPVDVEQIVGRILRQPYVMQHQNPMLNMSYVLTASVKFNDTLSSIIKGLNRAGFSGKDDFVAIEEGKIAIEKTQVPLDFSIPISAIEVPKEELKTSQAPTTEDFADLENVDITEIEEQLENNAVNSSIEEIEKAAQTQNEEFVKTVETFINENQTPIPQALQTTVKKYPIKAHLRNQVSEIILPQFHLKVSGLGLFGNETEVKLEKENLLEGFQLSKQGTDIDFQNVQSNIASIDIDETKADHTPVTAYLKGQKKQELLDYIVSFKVKADQQRNLTKIILEELDIDNNISQREVSKYVQRVVEDLDDEQLQDFVNQLYTYTQKIKDKITEHSVAFASNKFFEWLDDNTIYLKESFSFPKEIIPTSEVSLPIEKSLYEQEGKLNSFEERVIMNIASLPNVAFWTRIQERRNSFYINGFINHYPDFIVVTQSGTIVLVETKGDFLKNFDSKNKIRLGRAWSEKAGSSKYKYFMVFEKTGMEGAYNLDKFLELMKKL